MAGGWCTFWRPWGRPASTRRVSCGSPPSTAASSRQLDIPPAQLSSPQWAPDSESIYFLSDRSTRGTAQLHQIGRAGGSAQVLTGWKSGIHGHRPLVDPALVAIVAPDDSTEQDDQRDNDRNDAQVRGRARPARLRLLDLRTRQIRTPDLFGDRHVVDVVERPDGGPLAVLTWSTPDLDPGLLEPALHLLDPHTDLTHDLGPAAVEAHSPVWWRTPAGWHLAYLALTPPGLKAGTAVFDFAVPATGPAGAHRNITAGMPACPAELVQVDWGAPLPALPHPRLVRQMAHATHEPDMTATRHDRATRGYLLIGAR
jgi:hypothetical protein